MSSQGVTQVLLAREDVRADVLGGMGRHRLVVKYREHGCTPNIAQVVIREILAAAAREEQEEARRKRRERPKDRYIEAQLHPPVEAAAPNAELEALKREVALLREQLTWAQHEKSESRQGGKITLVVSDLHFTDRSHMLRCYEQMCDKAVVLFRQYQPEWIEVLSNGDEVAGTGIYRNQNMDSILQTGDEQIKVAAYKAQQQDALFRREFPNARVTRKLTRGNHDRALGEPLTEHLTLRERFLGVEAVYCGDCAILNLASAGTYHLYAEHGYGYSGISPSSPKWLSDNQQKLLRLHNMGYTGEQRIRRITHGHTHWHSLNEERILGYYWDTTGGLQRNERVLLGKNGRPVGWIAYVSPAGHDGILAPIAIQPDLDLLEEELADPYLFQRNMKDCAAALEAYETEAEQRGLTQRMEPDGR